MELMHTYPQLLVVSDFPAIHGKAGNLFLLFIVHNPHPFGELVKLRMSVGVKGFVPQHVLHHMAELTPCHYIPVHFFVKRFHFL